MKKFEQLLSLAWRMQHLLQENDLDSGEFGDELVAIQQAAQQSVQLTGATCPTHNEPVSDLIHYECGCSTTRPRN